MSQAFGSLMGSRFPSMAGVTILQIIPALDAGGAERTTIDIAVAVTAAGGRALVATSGGRLVSELQAQGGIWIPFPAQSKNPVAMAANVLRLARLIRLERPSLVHARSRAPAWVALGACRMTGVPFVTTFHGSYGGRSAVKLYYNSVMARADAVIANSDYTRQLIESHYPWAAPRITVVPRGTDLRQFSSTTVSSSRVQKLRAAWGAEPDQRIVLLAARLTSWKGHRVLIDAARLLRDRGLRDTMFILAGDPQGRSTYMRDIDTAVAAAKLNGIVKRVGHCDDMPAAFLAASLVVVPSTKPEAFGRSAVEAQALGTPVVVSDLGAVPETVLTPPRVAADARTGWAVPANEAEPLAAAILQALSLGATARDALAERARAHVSSQFSLEGMQNATLNLYASVLAEAARPKSEPHP